MIGCGAVAQTTIPLIPKYLAIPFSRITIVDMVDNSAQIKTALDAGAKFFVDEVTCQSQAMLGLRGKCCD